MDSSQQLDRVFHALADPTRRAMLRAVAQRRMTVSDLAEPFSMSLAAVSKHLRVLETAGLVHKERDGRSFVCSLVLAPLEFADREIRELSAFWEDRLNELETFLKEEESD